MAWSRILLVRIDSAPIIHLSLKFFLCIMRNRDLLHTEHLSFLTTFVLPSTAFSHSSHERVSNSRSKSCFHLSNVVYATFLFFSWEVPLVLQLHARFIINRTQPTVDIMVNTRCNAQAYTCAATQTFDNEDRNSDCIALIFKGNDMAIMLLKNTVMKNMISKNGLSMTDLIGQQHSLVGKWLMADCHIVLWQVWQKHKSLLES